MFFMSYTLPRSEMLHTLYVCIYNCALHAYVNVYVSLFKLAQDQIYIRKLWLVFITGKVVLWRYIAVWLIAVSETTSVSVTSTQLYIIIGGLVYCYGDIVQWRGRERSAGLEWYN